jgi:hypothetical protein
MVWSLKQWLIYIGRFLSQLLADDFIYVRLPDFPLRPDFESRNFSRFAPAPNGLVGNAEKFCQLLDTQYFIFSSVHRKAFPALVYHLKAVDFK